MAHTHLTCPLSRLHRDKTISPHAETAVADICNIPLTQHIAERKVAIIHHDKIIVSSGHLVELKHHNRGILAKLTTQEKTK